MPKAMMMKKEDLGTEVDWARNKLLTCRTSLGRGDIGRLCLPFLEEVTGPSVLPAL
jgi:hypothetical protein